MSLGIAILWHMKSRVWYLVGQEGVEGEAEAVRASANDYHSHVGMRGMRWR